MNCPKNKKHKIIMIEDIAVYDGISYKYCYDCKKLYDRWTGKDITSEYSEIVKQCKR
jgi:hypothetical protein